MKRSIRISSLIVFLFVFIFPQAALPAVKVYLKNGREIIADSCTEAQGKLVCEKMGGYFEIQKKDILETRGITLKDAEASREAEVPEGNKGQEAVKEVKKVKEPVKSQAETKGPEKQPGGDLILGLKPEDAKRFDQITARKMELAQEREKLGKEREQLQKDVKEMGMIYSKEQLETVNKRMTDIEAKIGKFNDEVKRLNEEEDKIVAGLKKKQ